MPSKARDQRDGLQLLRSSIKAASRIRSDLDAALNKEEEIRAKELNQLSSELAHLAAYVAEAAQAYSSGSLDQFLRSASGSETESGPS